MEAVRRFLIVALLVGFVLALGACAAVPQPTSSTSGAETTSSSVTPSGAAPLAPGRTAKRGGRVEVIGTLQRDDSGSLLIVGALPSQAAGGHVFAVIVHPGSVGGVDLSKLDWKLWLGNAPQREADARRFAQWRWFWDMSPR